MKTWRWIVLFISVAAGFGLKSQLVHSAGYGSLQAFAVAGAMVVIINVLFEAFVFYKRRGRAGGANSGDA